MEELDIKEVGYAFWKNKAYIIIAAVLGVAIGLVYSNFLVEPLYKSSTTLVLSKPSSMTSSGSSSITQTDVLLNQKLVATYSEIVKSRTIAKTVIENLKLEISEEDLMKKISVTSKEDTELLQITVSDPNGEVSAKVANELADVFISKIKEVYSIENVSVIDVAEAAHAPYNISRFKSAGMFGIGFMAIVCAIILLRVYLNNTVKTQEDLEKLLNLPVLAVIQKIEG